MEIAVVGPDNSCRDDIFFDWFWTFSCRQSVQSRLISIFPLLSMQGYYFYKWSLISPGRCSCTKHSCLRHAFTNYKPGFLSKQLFNSIYQLQMMKPAVGQKLILDFYHLRKAELPACVRLWLTASDCVKVFLKENFPFRDKYMKIISGKLWNELVPFFGNPNILITNLDFG